MEEGEDEITKVRKVGKMFYVRPEKQWLIYSTRGPGRTLRFPKMGTGKRARVTTMLSDIFSLEVKTIRGNLNIEPGSLVPMRLIDARGSPYC
jgi:hypothetical protein